MIMKLKQGRILWVSVALLSGLPVTSIALAQQSKPRFTEAYPDVIAARLRQKDVELQQLRQAPGGAVNELLMRRAVLWQPGQTLTVAFESGTVDLHRKIAEHAQTWPRFGNLKLDFGWSEKDGEYRSFSYQDPDYQADIRISFRSGNDWGGDWSAIGSQSIKTGYYGPGDPSMNLESAAGEDMDKVELRDLVLHEFGHALGAEHEHQSPESGCDQQWRWDDDPGYVSTTGDYGQLIDDYYGRRPGVYSYYKGAPDYWGRKKVDFNLRQLTDSSALDAGQFDDASIMMYRFPASFLWDGEASSCYWKGVKGELSPLDKSRIGEVYPSDTNMIGEVLKRKRSDAAELATLPDLPIVRQAIDALEKSMPKAAE